jgi:hypothetical protein
MASRVQARSRDGSAPIVPLTIQRQRFVGPVMKQKLGGFKRSTSIIIFGGPSLAFSLL